MNMRVKTARITSKRNHIEWRSHEPSRLETFSDAVFAFAVTLIIVSLEVPKTFDELFETMKGVFGFAACFAVLFNIWNTQNLFFRRFGLKDKYTVGLNAILLFVVLVYAYPLKFLFGLLFDDNLFGSSGHMHEMITEGDIPKLMTIYGAGYVAISLLFALMYYNAKRYASELKLTDKEIFATNSQIGSNVVSIFVGTIATLLAWILPSHSAGYSGFFYLTLTFAFTLWFSYRRRIFNKLFGYKS
jgi:hypothetical protein